MYGFGNYYGFGYPSLQYNMYSSLSNPMLQVSEHKSNSNAFTSHYVDNNDTPFKITLGILGVGTLITAAIAILSKGKAKAGESLGKKISTTAKTFEQETRAAEKLAEQGENAAKQVETAVENTAKQGTKRRKFFKPFEESPKPDIVVPPGKSYEPASIAKGSKDSKGKNPFNSNAELDKAPKTQNAGKKDTSF